VILLLLEVEHTGAYLLVLSRSMDGTFQDESEAAGVLLQLVFACSYMLQGSVFCLSPYQRKSSSVYKFLPSSSFAELHPQVRGREQYAIRSCLIMLPPLLFSRDPSSLEIQSF